MSAAPRISIIIRAYNESAYIGQLLYGISQQDIDDYEIIVVDSGSTDLTVDIALGFGCKIIRIKKEDFSFGKSLNVGIRAAAGEYIVMVSAHAYPRDKTWLRSLLKPLYNEKVAVSYGMQRGDNRNKFSELLLFQQWFPENICGAQSNYFCNNANSAIKKSDWIEYPYDEKLTGLEDLKFAKHFFELGREIHYCPDATIIHVHEETWPRVRNRYRREAIALKQIDPHIKFSFVRFVFLLISHIIRDIIAAIQKKCFFSNFWEIFMFRFNQLWGTYKGYTQKSAVTEEMKKRFYYPNVVDSNKDEYRYSNSNIIYPKNIEYHKIKLDAKLTQEDK